jgi:hypothetical protein
MKSPDDGAGLVQLWQALKCIVCALFHLAAGDQQVSQLVKVIWVFLSAAGTGA